MVCINTEFMCIGGGVRTNIVIDDELMTTAMQATGLKTKREAVEQGLKLLVQQSQQKKIRKLRGKLSWEGDLDQMRGSNDSRRY